MCRRRKQTNTNKKDQAGVGEAVETLTVRLSKCLRDVLPTSKRFPQLWWLFQGAMLKLREALMEAGSSSSWSLIGQALQLRTVHQLSGIRLFLFKNTSTIISFSKLIRLIFDQYCFLSINRQHLKMFDLTHRHAVYSSSKGGNAHHVHTFCSCSLLIHFLAACAASLMTCVRQDWNSITCLGATRCAIFGFTRNSSPILATCVDLIVFGAVRTINWSHFEL